MHMSGHTIPCKVYAQFKPLLSVTFIAKFTCASLPFMPPLLSRSTGYLLVVACSLVIVATLLCLLCIRGNIATAFDSCCHRHRRRCCRIRIHSTTFALLLCLPSLALSSPLPSHHLPLKCFPYFRQFLLAVFAQLQ